MTITARQAFDTLVHLAGLDSDDNPHAKPFIESLWAYICEDSANEIKPKFAPDIEPASNTQPEPAGFDHTFYDNGHTYITKGAGVVVIYCLTCRKYVTPGGSNSSGAYCDNVNTYGNWRLSFYQAWLNAYPREVEPANGHMYTWLADSREAMPYTFSDNGHTYVSNGDIGIYCLTCRAFVSSATENSCTNSNTYNGWSDSFHDALSHKSRR